VPELPEVETTKRGILPHISHHELTAIEVRTLKLRYPVPKDILDNLIGQPLLAINRRAKYLLLHFLKQTLIVHLGMSGSLRLVNTDTPWRKHDHWQLCFDEHCLRYHDPRKFGFLIASETPDQHPLIKSLGVEPLSDAFTASYLTEKCQKRRTPIKNVMMDNKVVVGIGNIYTCESLFMAGINPFRPANSLTSEEYSQLQSSIAHILNRAIQQGGSTLRDFLNPDGTPGYFAQTLHAYGQTGKTCPRCKQSTISNRKLAGRSTYYCPHCQH